MFQNLFRCCGLVACFDVCCRIFRIFFILTKFMDVTFLSEYILAGKIPENGKDQLLNKTVQGLTPFVYLIKYVNHYLLFQLSAALLMAVFMQRKEEQILHSEQETENN